MGYNGEVLVGRGDAFEAAVRAMWDWDYDVRSFWPLRDGWHAAHVRDPAEDEELEEFARAVGGPVLACWVFESDMGHIRGVGPGGTWEAWLNADYAAHLRAGEVVGDEMAEGTDPFGSPADQARLALLTEEYTAELLAERPAAVRSAVAWAGDAGLRADAERIGEILADPWRPQAQRGFFTLLTELGLRDPAPEGE